MIGIFGGTFDPVHIGHLRSAWEVRESLRIRDFRLLPAGQPPHREGPITPAEHRLAMLRLATHGLPGLRIDERELARSGPSYMVDTLCEIRSEAGDQPLLLIIGQDSAASLDQWHQWERLPELAHLVVMRRPEQESVDSGMLAGWFAERSAQGAAELHSAPCGKVWNVPVTQLAISSSRIRALIQAGRSPRFLLPDAVIEYIGTRGLYR
jgi:nicotinate-nucleotide adenylyltransferase